MENNKAEKAEYAREEFYIHARIKKIEEENYRVKTFVLDAKLEETKPGQFVMVWVPGIGERPFSLLSRLATARILTIELPAWSSI